MPPAYYAHAAFDTLLIRRQAIESLLAHAATLLRCLMIFLHYFIFFIIFFFFFFHFSACLRHFIYFAASCLRQRRR